MQMRNPPFFKTVATHIPQHVRQILHLGEVLCRPKRATLVPSHRSLTTRHSRHLFINSTFSEISLSSTEGRSSQAVCANRSACTPAFRRYRVGGMPFRRSRAVRQLASKSSDLGGCADCAVECCEGATRRSRALQALTTMHELSFPRLRGDARDRHRKQCQLTCVRS